MNIEKITINPASILSYESVCIDKINLPYSNDDLYSEAYNAFLDAMVSQDVETVDVRAMDSEFGESIVAAYITLLPYRRRLLAVVKIVVQLSSGQRIEKSIPATVQERQLDVIADRFLRMGHTRLGRMLEGVLKGSTSNIRDYVLLNL